MSQPRPALRRAADAEVHPALVVVPDATAPVLDLTDGTRSKQTVDPNQPIAPELPQPSETKEKIKAKKAKKQKKKKKAKAAARTANDKSAASSDTQSENGPLLLSSSRRFRGAGRATSDALVTSGKKQATLKAQIPRPLRTELREAAKASGVSTDALLTEILGAWFTDPDRW